LYLRDPDDRHVLAAAIKSGAHALRGHHAVQQAALRG
jgi:hypothetical protein